MKKRVLDFSMDDFNHLGSTSNVVDSLSCKKKEKEYMRKTFVVSKDLVAQLQAYAYKKRLTSRSVLENAIREYLLNRV